MSLTVFVAVLAAALLHAGWNALLRVGASRVQAMMVLSAGQGMIGLAILLGRGLPVAAAWPWILASAVIHSAYQAFLAFAYEHGDLSRVYPLARGTAPMLTLLASALWLSETISPAETTGILVLGAGILLLAGGVWTGGESRRMLPYAFGSAAATAGYTMSDGIGARIAGDAGIYLGWVMFLAGLVFPALMLSLRGGDCLPRARRVWVLGALGAAASYLSYAVVVWAMTVAPIPLVAAIRETSILFAVLLGWLVFRERMTRSKMLAAALIVTGALVTRFAG